MQGVEQGIFYCHMHDAHQQPFLEPDVPAVLVEPNVPNQERPRGRYGSYEACVEPHFELEHLPLVDRGFVYALAHVRGGGELGRLWHEDGKFLKKRNTFTDFIACAEHLVSLDYTRPELLCAEARAACLGRWPPPGAGRCKRFHCACAV